MARTPSNMMPLGTQAQDFNLYDTASGDELSLSEMTGSNGTLVVFMCNHCPFVIHILDELVTICAEYKELGISTVAISSNDVENYPQDAPDKMRELAVLKEFSFPYLYDEDQSVAKAYDAACTPDFYLFDSELKCVYRGQMDGSRPGNELPVNGEDLRGAMNLLIEGKPIPEDQKPSIGCNIKWK